MKSIMKKTLCIIVIGIVLFSGLAHAQYQYVSESPAFEQNFRFGPKVGFELFTPTIDQNEIESQMRSNYQAGIFLQFGRKFYFQPEFYYATRKEKSSNSTTDITINTLKVPLMFGIRLFNLKMISAHIMGGPSASFLLKESLMNPNSTRKKNNFAIEAGGGVDLFGCFTLDFRYSVDLNDSMNEQIKQLGWDSGVNVTFGIKI
jgi:hypothetical protein